ncbi:CoA transferase [Geodermatophilus sp. URMC 63]
MPTRNELAVVSAVLGPRFDPAQLTVVGPEQGFASALDITALATGSTAAAHLAAAELLSARTGGAARGVTIDRLQACASFRSEALFRPDGWQRPEPEALINANYRCVDGWIRLHAAYRWHRTAALGALGVDDAVVDKSEIAAVIAGRDGEELESAVIAAGGAAALMRTREQWDAHPAGSALASSPAVVWAEHRSGEAHLSRAPSRPLEGVRVLDLTRVIAGPTCTRFLAAQGASVLRIDPPGFSEMGDLVTVTTAGKRCAALDLHSPEGAARLASLVAESDVLVCGWRPDALTRLGFDEDRLVSLNPALVVARVNAYGWGGPWLNRRGFDSLVQMSTGIAADGQRSAGTSEPVELPCAALDYATGYFMAASVCRALTGLVQRGRVLEARVALGQTATLLKAFPAPADSIDEPPPPLADYASEAVLTAWGPVRTVPVPGSIDGVTLAELRPAGPLGRDAPSYG